MKPWPLIASDGRDFAEVMLGGIEKDIAATLHRQGSATLDLPTELTAGPLVMRAIAFLIGRRLLRHNRLARDPSSASAVTQLVWVSGGDVAPLRLIWVTTFHRPGFGAASARCARPSDISMAAARTLTNGSSQNALDAQLAVTLPESGRWLACSLSLRSTDAVASPWAAFEIARLHNRVIRSVPFCAVKIDPGGKRPRSPLCMRSALQTFGAKLASGVSRRSSPTWLCWRRFARESDVRSERRS